MAVYGQVKPIQKTDFSFNSAHDLMALFFLLTVFDRNGQELPVNGNLGEGGVQEWLDVGLIKLQTGNSKQLMCRRVHLLLLTETFSDLG